MNSGPRPTATPSRITRYVEVLRAARDTKRRPAARWVRLAARHGIVCRSIRFQSPYARGNTSLSEGIAALVASASQPPVEDVSRCRSATPASSCRRTIFRSPSAGSASGAETAPPPEEPSFRRTFGCRRLVSDDVHAREVGPGSARAAPMACVRRWWTYRPSPLMIFACLAIAAPLRLRAGCRRLLGRLPAIGVPTAAVQRSAHAGPGPVDGAPRRPGHGDDQGYLCHYAAVSGAEQVELLGLSAFGTGTSCALFRLILWS